MLSIIVLGDCLELPYLIINPSKKAQMIQILNIIFLSKSNLATKFIIDSFFITILLYLLPLPLNFKPLIVLSFLILCFVSGVYKSFYRHANFFDSIKITINAFIIVVLHGVYCLIFEDFDSFDRVFTQAISEQ